MTEIVTNRLKSPPGYTESFHALFISLMALFLSLHVADLWTTQYLVMRFGPTMEMNPLLSLLLVSGAGLKALATLKFTVVTLLMSVLAILYIRTESKEWLMRVGIAMNAMALWPVLNNLVIILSLTIFSP